SGYLTTETDPVFTGHSASGITSSAISNWNTAFGWGNHTGLYRLASYVPDWSDITGKPALAQVAVTGSYTDLSDIPAVFIPDVHTHPESDITDLRHYSDADIDGNEIAFNGWDKNASDDFDGDYNSLQNTPDLSQYLVSESDPVFSGHPSGSITLTDLDNWTRAFGWGDHSAEGYFRNGGETAGVDRTIGNIDSFALSFITDNTDRLYIDSRGHVGIGTQLPGNQLSVNGSADINTALQTPKLLPLSGDGNSLSMQTNQAYSGSGSLTIRTGNTTNTGGINSTGAITIETGSLSNNGGSTGTVTIRAGRSTNYAYDGSQLIVGGYPGGNGGGGLSLYSGNGWAGAGSILMKAGDAGWGPGGNITLQSGSGGGQAGSGSNIILNTGNDADAGPGSIMLQINGAEHMRMNQSGNVGIGTANPTAKLEVAGGVKVGSNGTRFTELFELTGTTVASGQISTITLPEGWTADNSRVLNIEVQHTGNLYWLGVANFMINQETSYLIKDDYITLYLPNDTYLNSAPYRVLLMRLE
ncbi:MAG: hypothetical protein JXR52_05335, partial [Bacteroidales bacterium]|nr:hypothetical protein [Bacteroidales bacterium]